MTENDIIRVLVSSLFKYNDYIVVPNVASLLPWEADLCVLTDSGYLYEVEVKSSAQDLKNDKKKRKHYWWGKPVSSRVKYMYYAAERSVFEAVDLREVLPDHAGLIVITGDHAEITRKPKQNPASRALTMEESLKLARLGTIRFWTRDNADLRVQGV